MLGLSKKEYWVKWEISQLLDDLGIVENIFDEKFGEEKFELTEVGELHANLIEAIDEIEYGNRKDLNKIYVLFCSNNKISQFIDSRDNTVLDRITLRVNKWKKKHNTDK